jgi:hypothetical protein
MLTASSYRKLADLYHKNKYAAELFLRLLGDYDLTTYKIIPPRVIRKNYRLGKRRYLYAMGLLRELQLIEYGPVVKNHVNEKVLGSFRAHPSALMSQSSLENFLVESVEREQRLQVAPIMVKPANITRPRRPKPVKKTPRPYIPPEVSVFDKLKPFYVEKF